MPTRAVWLACTMTMGTIKLAWRNSTRQLGSSGKVGEAEKCCLSFPTVRLCQKRKIILPGGAGEARIERGRGLPVGGDERYWCSWHFE